MGQIKTAGHRLAVEAIGDQPLAVEGSKKTAGHDIIMPRFGRMMHVGLTMIQASDYVFEA
jgi:hypothetical protein